MPRISLCLCSSGGALLLPSGAELEDPKPRPDGAVTTVTIVKCARRLDSLVRRWRRVEAAAAGDASLSTRTWVLLTEAIEGGWGLAGHANTNAELIDAARAQIAELQRAKHSAG